MSRTKQMVVLGLFFTVAFLATGDLAVAKKPPQEPPATTPQVKYLINFIQLPANAQPMFTPNGMSNGFLSTTEGLWDVQVVGSYQDRNISGRSVAALYDPTRNPNEVIDLNSWFPKDIWEATAWDISSDNTGRGVVVGSFTRVENGFRQGFAIDLAINPPVLDLLPTNGAVNSTGARINENGDILVSFLDPVSEIKKILVFNPGVYSGDPDVRAVRTTPLDFTDVDVTDLVLPAYGDPDMSGNSNDLRLNNPLEITAEYTRPAQIGTTTPWDLGNPGFPIVYTLGVGPEVFDFTASMAALNDLGSFCGEVTIRNKKLTYRYDVLGGLQTIPGALKNHTYPHDMNNSGDLLTRMQIYRDDTNAWVLLDDLIVGDAIDLALWDSSDHYFLLWPYISDRVRVFNSTEEAGIIAGGRSGQLVILTPVSP